MNKALIRTVGLLFTLIAITLMLIFSTGCTMDKPKYEDLPAQMSDIEKKATYKWLMCLYSQQFNKDKDLGCARIFDALDKDSIIINFDALKKAGMLPKLYNQKGESEMNFDDYFKYVK